MVNDLPLAPGIPSSFFFRFFVESPRQKPESPIHLRSINTRRLRVARAKNWMGEIVQKAHADINILQKTKLGRTSNIKGLRTNEAVVYNKERATEDRSVVFHLFGRQVVKRGFTVVHK